MRRIIKLKEVNRFNIWCALLIVFLTVQLLPSNALYAQLKGDHLLGSAGLQSGTQAPPGLVLVDIPLYLYNTSNLKDNAGNTLFSDFSLTSYAFAPGLSWVTNTKILGGNLGGSVLVPFISNKIESTNKNTRSSFALSDMFLQPVTLGWHAKQADYITSFSLYIPTGNYSFNGTDNSGLGMWGYEFSGGSTVYFDPEKTFSLAALLSYEFNGKKKNTDIRVGNLLSIEGGLGKTFYKKVQGPVPIIINVGASYYMQFKTTNDQIPTGQLAIDFKKDHTYGIGPEGNIFIPSLKSLFAVRWLFETGTVNRFQGSTFLLTWAFNIKSFKQAK